MLRGSPPESLTGREHGPIAPAATGRRACLDMSCRVSSPRWVTEPRALPPAPVTFIACHPLGDLGVVVGVAFLQQLHPGHDLARGAASALGRVAVDERCLDGMQLPARG